MCSIIFTNGVKFQYLFDTDMESLVQPFTCLSFMSKYHINVCEYIMYLWVMDRMVSRENIDECFAAIAVEVRSKKFNSKKRLHF